MGGGKWQQSIEDVAGAVEHARKPTIADDQDGLTVLSGRPRGASVARTWALCFSEFFYGDCAPGLERQKNIPYALLPRALFTREAHSLLSDAEELAWRP